MNARDNTPDRLVCSQAAARAAGLDVAPSVQELLVVAESIVSLWGDRWAEPDDLVASTADAGAQLARAVPLVLAELDRACRLRLEDVAALRASEQVLQSQIDGQAKEIDRLRVRITELEKQAAVRIAAGVAADNRHLLYDVDPDSTVPPLVDIHRHQTTRRGNR